MKHQKLHNIKSSGYTVPKDYFDSLEMDVFSKLKEEHIASKIQDSGFKLPLDYFESLDSKIVEIAKVENDSKVISLFNWKKLAYVTSVAASIVLLVSLFFTKTNEWTFNDVDTASIENYLMEEDLNAYDIAPYLNTEDITSSDFVNNTINASDLEDYLLQNSDVETLISD